jgi:Cof subfamily protein (haloacid dehalogenase superfamily)
VTYKLLAVDVDGTLVRRDGSIHPDDLDAIDRLQRRGVPVTIVTGRLYSGTRGVAVTARIEGPIACVDGSHIVDVRDDNPLYYRAIVGEHASSLRDILERRRAASFVFARDTIIHDPEGAPFAPYVRTWSPNVDVVDRVSDHPCWAHEHGLMAVVALGDEADIRATLDDLQRDLSHAIFAISFPVPRVSKFAIVARAKGPTKGTAIEWLARHHGCTAAEVVAVGDWINDVPMFQTAGRSFAMSQAPAAVKATATDTLEASAHDGGGVSEAIRRAWGDR